MRAEYKICVNCTVLIDVNCDSTYCMFISGSDLQTFFLFVKQMFQLGDVNFAVSVWFPALDLSVYQSWIQSDVWVLSVCGTVPL